MNSLRQLAKGMPGVAVTHRGSDDDVIAIVPCDPNNAESVLRHVRRTWQSVRQMALTRRCSSYIYGAGAHTTWLLGVTSDLPKPPIACILDDEPSASEIAGIAVERCSSCDVAEGSLILLSSDRFEETLAHNARSRFGPSVEIVRLYAGFPPGPYPHAEPSADRDRRLEATHRARKTYGGAKFVGPYERAGYVTGFLQEQWLWSRRDYLAGHVLDMSTPHHWHGWIHGLDAVRRVSISDLDQTTVTKLGFASSTDLQTDFCAADLPIEDNTFDTILCFSILEHCRRPIDMIRNLRRVLACDGHLFVTVPFAYIDGHCRPDYWRFARDGLALLAREAGFTHVSTGGLGDIGGLMTEVLGYDCSATNHHDGVPMINWLIASDEGRAISQ